MFSSRSLIMGSRGLAPYALATLVWTTTIAVAPARAQNASGWFPIAASLPPTGRFLHSAAYDSLGVA